MGSLLKSCASIDEIHKQITNQNEVQILKILLTSFAKKRQHARREIFPTEDDRIAWEKQEDEDEEKKRKRRRRKKARRRGNVFISIIEQGREVSIHLIFHQRSFVRSFEILFLGVRASVVFTLIIIMVLVKSVLHSFEIE